MLKIVVGYCTILHYLRVYMYVAMYACMHVWRFIAGKYSIDILYGYDVKVW